MSVKVGDKVVAVPDGYGGFIVSEGYVPKVGDSVIAHPLPSGGYVALPITSPKVGDKVSAMVAPYSYVPFGCGSIISYNGFTAHDLKIQFRVPLHTYLTLYGDSEPKADGSGVEIITTDPLYGAVEYRFTDSTKSEYDDLTVSLCLQDLPDGSGVESWTYVHPCQNPGCDYLIGELEWDSYAHVVSDTLGHYDIYPDGALISHQYHSAR